MGDTKLSEHSSRQIEEEEVVKTVGEYWEEDQGWRWETLSNSLRAMALVRLAGMIIPLPPPEATEEDRFG